MCPILCQLPEGHGRLVDADTIIEVMKKCAANPENAQALLCYRYAQRILEEAPTVEPASPWHRVEELPKESGEYIVAYHPCYWEDVDTSVTKVGIDNFRGKSAWAKKKFQRVTHWMEKPEPPKEDEDA